MPKGQLANAEMERVASLLVADLTSKGLSLGYTPGSLFEVDRVLANYGHSKGNGDRNTGLVELVGAYFGEVIRRHLGGNWYEQVPPDHATGLLLDEPSDFWVWCHAIVYKQLEQGNKSLHAIYPDVAMRLKMCIVDRNLPTTRTYELGWATLPGLRGLSVSEFRATPTDAPDIVHGGRTAANDHGVAMEFANEAERDEFLRQIENYFASRRFTNAADAFDSVKAYALEHAAKRF